MSERHFCPLCGSPGSIPDDLLDQVAKALEMAAALRQSAASLEDCAAALTERFALPSAGPLKGRQIDRALIDVMRRRFGIGTPVHYRSLHAEMTREGFEVGLAQLCTRLNRLSAVESRKRGFHALLPSEERP